MSPSFWQIAIVALVVLVLFGRGKISSLMGEVGKGITSFKKGIKDGTEEIQSGLDDADEAPKDITPAEEKDRV